MKILIKGGRVLNPATNMDEIADVLVEDSKVVAIEKEITEMVDAIDLNQMTPLDAMMFLCELKKK